MTSRMLPIAFATLLLVSAVSFGQTPSNPQLPISAPRDRATFRPPPNKPKYAPDRILVRFRPETPKARSQAAHAAIAAQVIRSSKLVRGLDIVRLPEKMMVGTALRAYRKDPNVLYAEPDYIVHALENPSLPNDPGFPQMWNLHNTAQSGGTPGADIHALEAWSLTTGNPNVVVGVLDSGIDYNHEDLNANMFRNTADCNNNGIDDDGNGLIDDCYGIDTANGDSDPMDDNGHGTHVAGIIGAAGNNGVGVVGVNWQVKLLACKFLDATGSGYTSNAIACLDYMVGMKNRGVNIVATNNSWGGNAFSQALLDAIDVQRQKGILFVAAAGNSASDNDASPFFPASFFLPNIIAVAATDSSDLLASFSDFGRQSVHLGAPGVDILSTFPHGFFDSPYYRASGTSMAAPHVAGVAALLTAQNPTRDWRAIKNLILAGGDSNPSLAGTISGKRLNAFGALTCADQGVSSRLLPLSDEVAVAEGSQLTLAMLNIRCGSPAAGALDVIVQPGGTAIRLTDDGLGADQAADDGIFTGTWTMSVPGSYSLQFPNGDVVKAIVPLPYVYSNVPFAYRDVVGTNLNLGDFENASITPPFPIRFGGVAYSTIYISSSGAITLVPYDLPWRGGPWGLPTGFHPEYLYQVEQIIAPFWDYLLPQPGSPRNVFWDVLGTAPNRELVIEWRDLNHVSIAAASQDAAITFQVVFSENSDNILFNYRDVDFGPDWPDYNGGGDATIGLQVSWDFATQYGCCGYPSLSDSMSILWSQGQSTTPVINAASPPEMFAGSARSELGVYGSYFEPGAVVYWNGSPLRTEFSRNTELYAHFDSNNSPNPGTIPVYVLNPGGEKSNVIDYLIRSGSVPIPHIDSINPTSVVAGTKGLRLTVNGSGFLAKPGLSNHSVLEFGAITETDDCAWDCVFPETVVINDHLLIAAVPDYALASPIMRQVRVSNPDPIWEPSNFVDFDVSSPDGVTLTVRADTLTFNIGGGVVRDDQGKMACHVFDMWVGPVLCTAVYPVGTTVTVTATPDTGFDFMGWSLGCSGTGTCALSMDKDKQVSATFRESQSFSLDVSRVGLGAGTVRSNPDGIDCGTKCWASFASAAVVTLTATPAGGSTFLGWGGDCSGTGTCSVTMNANKNATAAFDVAPPFDFGPPPAPNAITAGQSAQFLIEMISQPGFAGTVSFICSSGVPQAAACAFNPPSVSFGAGNTRTTLTVTTTARNSAALGLSSVTIYACLLLPLILVTRAKRFRKWTVLISIGIMLAAIGTMVACGGGSAMTSQPPNPPNPSGTPAGTYALAITGTSGNVSRTQTVTLVVN